MGMPECEWQYANKDLSLAKTHDCTSHAFRTSTFLFPYNNVTYEMGAVHCIKYGCTSGNYTFPFPLSNEVEAVSPSKYPYFQMYPSGEVIGANWICVMVAGLTAVIFPQ